MDETPADGFPAARAMFTAQKMLLVKIRVDADSLVIMQIRK